MYFYVILCTILAVSQAKSMTKRGEACEELADALDALATELPSILPDTAQQVTDTKFGIQMIDSQFGPWDRNPSDKERLARVACKFQKAGSIQNIANLLGLPPQLLQQQFAQAKAVLAQYGGLDGIHRVGEHALKALKALDDTGILDFN